MSEQDDQNEVLCDVVRAIIKASDGPTRLNTLVIPAPLWYKALLPAYEKKEAFPVSRAVPVDA